jgi:hypothetical protein
MLPGVPHDKLCMGLLYVARLLVRLVLLTALLHCNIGSLAVILWRIQTQGSERLLC